MATSSDVGSNKLEVCLRIKPSIGPNNEAFTVTDETRLRVQSNTRGTEIFKFSKIFGQNSSQNEIFDYTVKNSVESFLSGNDCLVFAYGTTNAGKTYSVQGTRSEPGLIPRAMQHIFRRVSCAIDDNPRIAPINFKQAQIRNSAERLEIDKMKTNILSSFMPQHAPLPPSSEKFSISFNPAMSSTICETVDAGISSPSELPEAFKNNNSRCSIWISMLEVYNETVYDLLVPIRQSSKSSVKLLSDGMGNFCPQDNIEVHVSSLEEANSILQYGQKQRTTMATLLNINSSRSHCILRVRLLRVDRSAPSPPIGALSPAADVEDINVSTFMFIDLAGSERFDKSGTLKNSCRARETGNINSSLLVLGRCMEILKLKGDSGNSSRNMVVPYRDSKLTKILQPLLSVPGPKSLLVNINTCPNLFEETHNVLKFSCVARVVEFKEPPKPLPVTKRLPVNVSTVESIPPAASSDTEMSDQSSSQSLSMEHLDEEKKLRVEAEAKLEAALKEYQELQVTLEKLKTEQAQSEKALRKELQNEYEMIEKEIRDSHKQALERKENQYITLMEERLDLQQEYYQQQLAVEKASVKCSKQYCDVLEIALKEWDGYAQKVVLKEELDKTTSTIAEKDREIERLGELMFKQGSEILDLKKTIADLEESQQAASEASHVAESELQEELVSLQQEIKSQLNRIKTLTNSLDEKDAKIAVLKENLKSLTATANKLQTDCNRFKGLTNFIVNEYHPSARDSLATHSEEETWTFIQKEFNMMPSKCKELEKENSRLQKEVEYARVDYKKLEDRRNAQLVSYEEELRVKNNQLDMERREVQALQKQLLGMTPKMKENNTPQRVQEFKTPMAALSNSVLSFHLNSPSPCPSTNNLSLTTKVESSAASNPILTRSSGRKKRQVVSNSEKENNSPLQVAKPEKAVKKKGTSRRKLCSDSAHPALDGEFDEVIDFKVPEENEVQKTRRRLRSTYK